jgi:hypothetical protein
MRKIIGGFLAGLVLLANAGIAGAQAPAIEALPSFDWLTWERLTERRTVEPVPQRFTLKGHIFTIYAATPEHPAIFLAERRGRIVHLSTADRFSVIAYRERDWGEGPDLLIDAQNAGSGQGARLHAFVLAPRFTLQTIGLGDTYAGSDESGETAALRVQFSDYAFMGWNAPIHLSPIPTLHLAWTGTRYEVEADSLGRYSNDPAMLDRWTADARDALAKWKAKGGRYMAIDTREGEAGDNNPPSVLWRYVLELVYTGDAAAAKRLFDTAWTDDIPGKREFWHDFLARLRNGQAWRDLDLETALDAHELFKDFAAQMN